MSEKSTPIVDSSQDQAPEIDRSAEAPQHYPVDEGLQPYYNAKIGLHPARDRDPLYSVDLSTTPTPEKPHRSKLCAILIAVTACTALLSIGLGVGLGIGLRHNDSSSSSSDSNSPSNAPSTLSTSLSSSVVPSSTPAPAIQGILNDTSLAAVTSNDGNRHLFFQHFNGSLRHTVHDHAVNAWTNNVDFVATPSVPQMHTPLAAVNIEYALGQIHLFYVGMNGSLAAALYQTSGEYTGNLVPMNGSFLAAAGTRSLSVTTRSFQNGTSTTAMMLYEAPNGNITVLRGSFTVGGPLTQWIWQNVSEAVYSSLKESDLWLSPPVSALYSGISDSSTMAIQLAFFNSDATLNDTSSPLYTVYYTNWTDLLPNQGKRQITVEPAYQGSSRGNVPNNATAAIRNDDIMLYNFNDSGLTSGMAGPAFVQDQQLSFNLAINIPTPNPSTPYPFTRLAWINSTADNAVFVYHQLSDSLLVEDACSMTTGWYPTNISIETNS